MSRKNLDQPFDHLQLQENFLRIRNLLNNAETFESLAQLLMTRSVLTTVELFIKHQLRGQLKSFNPRLILSAWMIYKFEDSFFEESDIVVKPFIVQLKERAGELIETLNDVAKFDRIGNVIRQYQTTFMQWKKKDINSVFEHLAESYIDALNYEGVLPQSEKNRLENYKAKVLGEFKKFGKSECEALKFINEFRQNQTPKKPVNVQLKAEIKLLQEQLNGGDLSLVKTFMERLKSRYNTISLSKDPMEFEMSELKEFVDDFLQHLEEQTDRNLTPIRECLQNQTTLQTILPLFFEIALSS